MHYKMLDSSSALYC